MRRKKKGRHLTKRVIVPPQRWQHLQVRVEEIKEYTMESAQIIAMAILHMNNALSGMYDFQACSFLQTYNLKQGIKRFGEKVITSAH